MKKLKLILHIGTEKTGTSSIQQFLDNNRENLKNNNIHFLKCAGNTNNRKLPAAILDVSDALNDDFYKLHKIESESAVNAFQKKFFAEFKSEIEGLGEDIHTVIISSEHFHSRVNSSHLTSKLYKLLHEYFDDITILCYVREQSQVCESWYSTALKNGHSSNFSDFVKDCRVDNKYYNYFDILEKWADSFGFEAINARLFDKSYFFQNNLLDDLISVLDIELIDKLDKDIVRENESINEMGQLFAKSLNKALKNPHSSDLNAARKLTAAKQKLYNVFSGKGVLVTKDDYLRIKNEFMNSNLALFNKYFNSSKSLFNERDVSLLSKKYTSDDEMDCITDIILSVMNFSISFKDEDAEKLRDLALFFGAQKKYDDAYYLMSLAHEIRPNGPLIKSKLSHYKEALSGK